MLCLGTVILLHIVLKLLLPIQRGALGLGVVGFPQLSVRLLLFLHSLEGRRVVLC